MRKRMSHLFTGRKLILGALVVVFLLAAAYAGLRSNPGSSEGEKRLDQVPPQDEVHRLLTVTNFFAPQARGKAPDFTLISLGGDQVRLSQYRGQVVLLNFWATW